MQRELDDTKAKFMQAQKDALKYKKLAKQLVQELKMTKANMANAELANEDAKEQSEKVQERAQELEKERDILRQKLEQRERKLGALQKDRDKQADSGSRSLRADEFLRMEELRSQVDGLQKKLNGSTNEIEEMIDLLRMLITEVVILAPSVTTSNAPKDPNEWNFDQILDTLTSFLTLHKRLKSKMPDTEKLKKAKEKVAKLEDVLIQREQEIDQLKESEKKLLQDFEMSLEEEITAQQVTQEKLKMDLKKSEEQLAFMEEDMTLHMESMREEKRDLEKQIEEQNRIIEELQEVNARSAEDDGQKEV
jgi:DNA repair exonuclease SbcCD ATPase subunit